MAKKNYLLLSSVMDDLGPKINNNKDQFQLENEYVRSKYLGDIFSEFKQIKNIKILIIEENGKRTPSPAFSTSNEYLKNFENLISVIHVSKYEEILDEVKSGNVLIHANFLNKAILKAFKNIPNKKSVYFVNPLTSRFEEVSDRELYFKLIKYPTDPNSKIIKRNKNRLKRAKFAVSANSILEILTYYERHYYDFTLESEPANLLNFDKLYTDIKNQEKPRILFIRGKGAYVDLLSEILRDVKIVSFDYEKKMHFHSNYEGLLIKNVPQLSDTMVFELIDELKRTGYYVGKWVLLIGEALDESLLTHFENAEIHSLPFSEKIGSLAFILFFYRFGQRWIKNSSQGISNVKIYDEYLLLLDEYLEGITSYKQITRLVEKLEDYEFGRIDQMYALLKQIESEAEKKSAESEEDLPVCIVSRDGSEILFEMEKEKGRIDTAGARLLHYMLGNQGKKLNVEQVYNACKKEGETSEFPYVTMKKWPGRLIEKLDKNGQFPGNIYDILSEIAPLIEFNKKGDNETVSLTELPDNLIIKAK